LITSKLVWTTNEFEHKKLQIHSLQSAFIFICLQTKEIFQIDTNSFELKNLTRLPIDCLSSTIKSDNRLYILSNDQTTIVEFNINNQNLKILPSIQLNSSKIIQLSSVADYLILHTDDNQIFLWWKETEPIIQLEKSSRLISKDHRLVLLCADDKNLILYDLKEKLRGIIQLDDDAGQCEALCLSDYHKECEQYLFIICHDRCLRMFRVADGKQVTKIFIHEDLDPFIGFLNNRLLLKVSNHLCIIKLIDQKSLPKR
jgi:WD40 repeat protein